MLSTSQSVMTPVAALMSHSYSMVPETILIS